MIFSNLLHERMKDNMSEEALAYVQKINLSANRLSGMVDGVLKYSIINANEEELKKVNFKIFKTPVQVRHENRIV